MKVLSIALFAPFLAISAMAGVTVGKQTNNGTVSPSYQQSTECHVSQGTRYMNTKTGSNPVVSSMKKANYTKDVPNEAVLASLVSEVSSQAQPEVRSGPVGGYNEAYTANLNGRTMTLARTTGNFTVSRNTSDAAKSLIRFAEANCDQF